MFFSLSSLAMNVACCIVTVYLAMQQHANHSDVQTRQRPKLVNLITSVIESWLTCSAVPLNQKNWLLEEKNKLSIDIL